MNRQRLLEPTWPRQEWLHPRSVLSLWLIENHSFEIFSPIRKCYLLEFFIQLLLTTGPVLVLFKLILQQIWYLATTKNNCILLCSSDQLKCFDLLILSEVVWYLSGAGNKNSYQCWDNEQLIMELSPWIWVWFVFSEVDTEQWRIRSSNTWPS